jgi:uncharacterized membrane protein YecN with MAPEG domain
MNWIKDVLTDIIVTIVIVIAVFFPQNILTGIILGYSILMLIAKLVVYFGDFQLQMMRKVQNDAPEWFSHVLYAINVIALLASQWWYTGSIWIAIWIMSWLTQHEINSSHQTK